MCGLAGILRPSGEVVAEAFWDDLAAIGSNPTCLK